MNIVQSKFSFLFFICILISLNTLSCKKKNIETDPIGTETETEKPSNAPSTMTRVKVDKNFMFDNLIGYHGDHLYTTGFILNSLPDVSNKKKFLAQIHSKDRKVVKITEITMNDLLKSDAISMDEQGNTYIYGYAGGNNMGAMKIDKNGQVLWAKRYVMDLGIYDNYTSLDAKAVKYINGYLWCLSTLYLYKVDAQTGEVLATTGISSKNNSWTHGNDILKAGSDIMVMIPGARLQYRVYRVSDLKAIRHVIIDFADTKPAMAFPSNTIHQIGDDRYFAISDYRSQNGFFATPILVEFDSKGKVYNSAIFHNSGNVIITKVHKNTQGQFAVTLNVVTDERENIKSLDVLVFDKNLQLVSKKSIDRKYGSDAFPIDKSNVALINGTNLSFDWIDLNNTLCLAEKYQTLAIPKELKFNAAEITNNPEPYTSHMKLTKTENIVTTTANFTFNQTSTTICN